VNSQRANEAKLEANMKAQEKRMMEVMEGLKGALTAEITEGLKQFLMEKLPEGDTISQEIQDEEQQRVTNSWRNSSFGSKTSYIPKIDMRKFDGTDPVNWILQMEQFFDLHDVQPTQKVCIASLYLEPNQFVWY